MKVVGVDQSYTGFGHCVDGTSKKKMFPASKYDSDVQRLAAIREWFEEWLLSISPVPALVVMEGYANAAKFGREMAGELGAVVKLAVYDHVGNDRLLIVPPTSLKKFVTGKGTAKKNEMLLGVYKRWGESFADDNQADAYSLEKFGYGYLWRQGQHVPPRGQEVSYPQYQIEAIDKVRQAT